jgi:hypothetical protein
MENENQLLDNECPVCGAQSHEGCESNIGYVRHVPHRQRWDSEYRPLVQEHSLSQSFIYLHNFFSHPCILLSQERTMATSNNPLAPNAVTDIDGADVFPPLKPIKDLGVALPEGAEDDDHGEPHLVPVEA